MDPSELARKAYANSAAPIRTPRHAEYEAFARVTRRLQQAGLAPTNDVSATAHAIYDNRQLWTTLAVDVADGGNQLPSGLRAQIFYLAEFTNTHSTKVLRGEATTTPLIEINTAIMRGLKQQETAV